jgi:hypothetical protein
MPAIAFRRRAAGRRLRWLPDGRGKYVNRTTGQRYRKTFEKLDGRQSQSTGRASERGGIRVMVGADPEDARLVFLHELGHWLAGCQHAHDSVFWKQAWDLYEKHGIDEAYALEREGGYRKGAISEYQRRRIEPAGAGRAPVPPAECADISNESGTRKSKCP